MLDLGIIPDSALLMHSGAIVTVGSTEEVTRHTLAANAEEVDCRGKAILPGFVDSHTHPVFTAPGWWILKNVLPGQATEE